MEEERKIDYHIRQIAKALGLAEPVGFMLSYEIGDIWIDIYLDKGEKGWENRTYTVSVPKNKEEQLKEFVRGFIGETQNIIADSERVYASLTQEDWEVLSSSITNLL